MTIQRTDIHCPSRINPAEYEYVGIWSDRFIVGDLGFFRFQEAERTRIRNHMVQSKGDWAGHQHGGSCMVCGAHAIYLAVFYHQPSNEYVRTGFDCAANIDGGNPDRFRRFTKAKEAALKARAGWKKAEGVLKEKGLGHVWEVAEALRKPDKETLEGILRESVLAGDETAKALLHDLYLDQGKDPLTQPDPTGKEEGIMLDIVGKLAQYGSLSEKQYWFLGKLSTDIKIRGILHKIEKSQPLSEEDNSVLDNLDAKGKEHVAKLRERVSQKLRWAEEKSQAQDVPLGKRLKDVDVEILKVTEYVNDNPFGPSFRYGSPEVVTKIFVKAVKEGYTLYGSCPRGIQAEKGIKFLLSCTPCEGSDDPKHAKYKRPHGKVS